MFSLSFWAPALLIMLNLWPCYDTEEIFLEQPSRSVKATIGGSAVLPCRSKTHPRPGPVRWYKGTGPNRELIFSDSASYQRVQKVNNTNRVLDIRIINITLQDEGIYYCIKFQKDPEVELKSGGGTRLIVGEDNSSSGLITAMVVSVSVILILVFFALCYYFKRQKGLSQCSTRPETSKKNKSKREPTRNNEIVYAELQHMGKNPKSMGPVKGKGLHSEYATIHIQ